MKHLIFTHADLDGLVSCINVYNIIKNPEENFQYMVVGYNNFIKNISKISKEKYDILWILDINLPEEELDKLYEASKDAKKVIWIDHHRYAYDVIATVRSRYPNWELVFIHDESKSASLATNEFIAFNWKEAHNRCRELSLLANTYDMWIKDDPTFADAYALNDLYWEFKYEKFFAKFKNGYELDQECIDTTCKILTDREAYVNETFEKYLIHQDGIALVFNPACKYTNHMSLELGADFYIVLKGFDDKQLSYSIRIYKKDFSLTIQDVFGKIKESIEVPNCGGHENVGGITVSVKDNDTFIDLITDIFTDQKYMKGKL